MQAIPPSETDAAALRGFSRFYTRLIGTLEKGLLNTKYSLGEARVLYELASRPSTNAREVAGELGIDPGYLSRVVAKLEREGLLKRKVSSKDARSADITLTPKGKSEFSKLDTLSQNQALGILSPLTQPDRGRLISSMRVIESMLAANKPDLCAPRVLRPPRAGDMGWVVFREGAVYSQEFGFDTSFEALVARIVSDFVSNFDPQRERCWFAEVDGKNMGHVFLVNHPEYAHCAKLRLLFVEPAARGMGLGQLLVNECVQFARSAGYLKILLWTQSILTAAHRIYEKAGFRLLDENPHHSFGKDLIGQTWELEL